MVYFLKPINCQSASWGGCEVAQPMKSDKKHHHQSTTIIIMILPCSGWTIEIEGRIVVKMMMEEKKMKPKMALLLNQLQWEKERDKKENLTTLTTTTHHSSWSSYPFPSFHFPSQSPNTCDLHVKLHLPSSEVCINMKWLPSVIIYFIRDICMEISLPERTTKKPGLLMFSNEHEETSNSFLIICCSYSRSNYTT